MSEEERSMEEKMRDSACVWGWVARAPGPASACLHNPVVADILRLPVSTFVLAFAAFSVHTIEPFLELPYYCQIIPSNVIISEFEPDPQVELSTAR